MLKTAAFTVAYLVVSGSAQAAPDCNADLVKDTGSAWSTSQQDWRLASTVTETDYNNQHKGGEANATIYGIPMGANYNEFRTNIKTLSTQTNESLTQSQAQNIIWSKLDQNSSPNYQKCIDAYIANQAGLHLTVVAATVNDIALKVTYNVPHSGPIKVKWVPDTMENQKLSEEVDNSTIVRVMRPKKDTTLSVNFGGYSSETITLTPLPTALPPLSFLEKLALHSAGIRLNFDLGSVGDRKPAELFWRVATYAAGKTGTSTSVTGWYPLSCYSEKKNACAPGQSGNWEGRVGTWDEQARTISIDSATLRYDVAGMLSDATGKVGYISFDP
jgi:hypothetical protein